MKYFSWKWVAFGLAYSLLVMSILNMGMPAEVNSKLVPAEWLRIIYDILTAGWGNLTVITMISVLAFSTFPCARAQEKKISLLASMLVVAVPATTLGLVLAFVLMMPVPVLAFVLAFVLALVLMPVLGVLYHATKNTTKSAARNVSAILAKNN